MRKDLPRKVIPLNVQTARLKNPYIPAPRMAIARPGSEPVEPEAALVDSVQLNAAPPPQQQSPVDLRDPVYAPELGRGFQVGWYVNQAIEAVPVDEHGERRVDVAAGESLRLGDKEFELKGFHFHGPSEHLVNGSSYPMELHLVHQNPEDGSRAVVGVFLDGKGEVESQADTAMKNLIADFDRAAPVGERFSLDGQGLLPESREKFYRYEGSLTTPGYDENVSWVVMKEPVHLAPETLTELQQKFAHEPRETQALNRRFVLANFQD
jgi:carbonic anhydrase